MAYSNAPPLNAKLKALCRELVMDAAERHDVPPVYITSHVRVPAAVIARREVQVAMIERYGMKAYQVAHAFDRDKRRVRGSVLGIRVKRPASYKEGKILVGVQFVWKWAEPQDDAPASFKVRRWVREIPDEVISRMGEDQRNLLKRKLKAQLARL